MGAPACCVEELGFFQGENSECWTNRLRSDWIAMEMQTDWREAVCSAQ
jgi:hypothetical protein